MRQNSACTNEGHVGSQRPVLDMRMSLTLSLMLQTAAMASLVPHASIVQVTSDIGDVGL